MSGEKERKKGGVSGEGVAKEMERSVSEQRERLGRERKTEESEWIERKKEECYWGARGRVLIERKREREE